MCSDRKRKCEYIYLVTLWIYKRRRQLLNKRCESVRGLFTFFIRTIWKFMYILLASPESYAFLLTLVHITLTFDLIQ